MTHIPWLGLSMSVSILLGCATPPAEGACGSGCDGLCVEGVCRSVCSGDCDCGPAESCRATSSSGVSVCVPGEPCGGGACIEGVCRGPCDDDCDCGEGNTCVGTSLAGLSVCVPGARDCSAPPPPPPPPPPECGGVDCDDGNACTEDFCEDDLCLSRPVPDSILRCAGDVQQSCERGRLVTSNCPEICQAEGQNVYGGCSDALRCICGLVDEPCDTARRACGSDDDLFTCDPSEGFWRLRSCDDLCVAGGFTRSTDDCGPGSDGMDSCTCCNAMCAGRECGDDGCGGSCGTCVGAERCVDGQCRTCGCEGRRCGSDGCGGSCGSCSGGAVCRDGACECPSGCRQRSVCCGGGLCGGDCVGTPCC